MDRLSHAAMLVPLPKDQISDISDRWNMKRGGTMWNRCGTARPATWCIRLGCQLPGLRSQCGSGARKPSMRSMRSRRSTGPCQAPKSRKSPKSNTERTTTAKLRLSVFSWNKLNKDKTRIKQWIMNNPNVSSLRITIQVLPSIWQKKPSAFRSSRLNARFTWKWWKMKKKHFWDKHLKTFHKTLYLLYFWFIRYFWDVKIVKTVSEKEVITEQLLQSDVMPALGKCLWAAPVEGHLQPLCHFGCTELRLWAYSTFQEATKIQQIHCSM